MLKAILDTLLPDNRNAVERTVETISARFDNLGPIDLDVKEKAKDALAILAGSGISAGAIANVLGSARERSGAVVQSGARLVRNNPRNAGIGVGTVAVAAVGAYVFFRMMDARSNAGDDDTLLIEDGRELEDA